MIPIEQNAIINTANDLLTLSVLCIGNIFFFFYFFMIIF
jgi:hypothetical protein